MPNRESRKPYSAPWHSNSHETGLPGKRCKDTADSDNEVHPCRNAITAGVKS